MTRIPSLILFIFILIFSGGCSDFREAMNLQDEYFESFTKSKTSKGIELFKEHTPSVERGSIETIYSAVLPKGIYTPIASSNNRTFYQAPNGFRYSKDNLTESGVGGIVQIRLDDFSEFYVWFLPKEIDYFEINQNDDWHKHVKPGLLNIAGRPWVESDLKVNP